VRTSLSTALFLCLTLTAPSAVAAAPPGPPAGRTDAFGDALPTDAAFRLGTDRLRLGSRVDSLSFSRDGKSLASADAQGLVRVWDAQSGKLRFQLPTGTATTVVFSPDSKLLGTAGDRKAVRLWNAADGKPIRTLLEVGLWPLAFSPDGKALLCIDHPDNVLLLDVESGKELRRFEGIPYFARALAFSPDGKSVAACDDSKNTLVVWDAANGKERFRITDQEQGKVSSLDFSPDGKLLASAGWYRVCLWDALTGKRQATFKHPAASNAVAFDATGNRLVTGAEVCVIDVARREIVRRMMEGTRDRAGAVALSPDGKTIASGAGDDTRIRLWDIETGKEKLAVGNLNAVHAVAVSPDGKLIASVAGDVVRLWDAVRGTEVRTLKFKGDWVYWHRDRWKLTLSFSADGRTISTAGLTWDVATGREIEPKAQPRARQFVASPDEQTVAALEGDADTGLPLVVRDAGGRLLHRLALPADKGIGPELGGMALSPDGRLLALAVLSDEARSSDTPSDTVRLWDVTTGKLLRTFCPSGHVPDHVLFSPDGALLATSGSFGNPPQLWDVSTGRQLHQFAEHMDRRGHWVLANPVAFSPDGSLLALGGTENAVVVVEAVTGGVVRVLRGHSGLVLTLAFTPDGRTLVSGAADATVLAWPVAPAGAAQQWNADKADSLWKALEQQPAAAYPAVWALAAAPDRAVPFLKERLRPDAEVDERQVVRWIADLGHDEFDRREEATKRLRDHGARVEPLLRKALAGEKEAERLRRLEELLAALEGKNRDSAMLRDLRAVLALEQMGTPAAEGFLEGLARGGESGPRTRAARAALVRLEARRQEVKPHPAVPSAPPQGSEPKRLYAHEGEVHAVAFTPDGKAALSAGRDGKVRRWDMATTKELPALSGHEGGTFALAVSPDGRHLASAGADGRVRLWDLADGREMGSLAGHKGAVFAVAFGPNGNLLASGGEDGSARVWNVAKREERHLIRASAGRVTTVPFTSDGRSLLTGGIGSEGNTFDGLFVPNYAPEVIAEWSVETGKEVRKRDRKGSALAAPPGGKFLVIGSMSVATAINSGKEGPFSILTGDVALVDAVTGKPRLVVEGHGSMAALSAEGRLLATAAGSDFHAGGKTRAPRGAAADAGSLRLWEVLSGQEVLRFPGDPPTALAFSPDGRHLLFGTRAGAVCLVGSAPPGAAGAERPDRKTLEALWNDLGSADAAVAYRALVALGAARDDAPAFLEQRLRPAAADDAGLRSLIADLDAERYVVRRAAFAELVRRGAEVAPGLRAALTKTESPRGKQRLEQLLAAPAAKVFPDPLRRLRAAQVLERIGTPEAKRVLGALPPVPEPIED